MVVNMKLTFGDSRFQGYTLSRLHKDAVSGLVVGIVAIPLGMAFAIASGVKPEYGLYTTIIAGVLISLLGGSRFQIGGPTGAFIPILFAIVMEYGYENLLIAGFMAGVMLLAMGLLRLGGVIKFIPRPVTVGFTTGIAVTIFTGQLGNFLGLRDLAKHEAFIDNMKELGLHLQTVNPYSVVTAGISLALIVLMSRRLPKIPGSLIALLVSGGAAALLFPGQVATIGTTFGAIPARLPELHAPHVTWEQAQALIKPAFVIAMLGGIESLLSAVVADGMTGTRHNSNRELIGQGIANMVAPLFGGIPATGAIARTATNIKNGATSPVSGIVHGLVVLLVLMLLAPLASHIPLASMAPVLMVVAWNMSERSEFIHILKARSAESLVLLCTFVLTVFATLPVAVEAGLVLSVLIFVKRMGGLLKIAKVLPDRASAAEQVSAGAARDGRSCPQISMYTIEGPLFFGVAHVFEKSIMHEIGYKPGALVLRMGNVPYIDATAEAYLAGIVRHFHKHGGAVYISEIQEQPRAALAASGLDAVIGKERLFARTGEALRAAMTRLDSSVCAGCPHDAFRECAQLHSGRQAAGLSAESAVAPAAALAAKPAPHTGA